MTLLNCVFVLWPSMCVRSSHAHSARVQKKTKFRCERYSRRIWRLSTTWTSYHQGWVGVGASQLPHMYKSHIPCYLPSHLHASTLLSALNTLYWHSDSYYYALTLLINLDAQVLGRNSPQFAPCLSVFEQGYVMWLGGVVWLSHMTWYVQNFSVCVTQSVNPLITP